MTIFKNIMKIFPTDFENSLCNNEELNELEYNKLALGVMG